ncbi:expressed unknown protein [Seminavis robusta]|uniref:Uncharacterized protein n=1 Tax=Seminavis robusta TaxID=568900 RepID=A0A9N8E3J7_9STRA|nr:expressed unknown protein [Seminavis robusta]|eukprot:Sro623_g177160.1 n/a (75) ;mRNA; r:33191-33512
MSKISQVFNVVLVLLCLLLNVSAQVRGAKGANPHPSNALPVKSNSDAAPYTDALNAQQNAARDLRTICRKGKSC